MKDSKNSTNQYSTKNNSNTLSDIYVNTTLNEIFKRIIDNKEIIDDNGNTVNAHEKLNIINTFKNSINI